MTPERKQHTLARVEELSCKPEMNNEEFCEMLGFTLELMEELNKTLKGIRNE